nr:uncharacterized protein LOC121118770 [Lepeophtheirus salmonis]XP_040569291.1 uncharacterized protein LOC121118770 [Lepeophtheirus salmonis]
MIRADLIYRCEPQKISKSRYHWVTVERVRSLGPGDEREVALECTVVEAPQPLVRCNNISPMNYRLRLICSHPKGNSIFSVTFLGLYAINIAALEPCKGEVLILTQPRVFSKRPPRKKSDSKYEVFIGTLDNDISMDKKPSHVIIKTPEGRRMPKDKRGTTDDIMFNPSACSKEYTLLAHINKEDLNTSYNVWAVVTKVKRDPSPTNSKFMMATVYIIDEHYQGSFNFYDFQFSILSKDLDDYPPIRSGCIIRIHNMRLREWAGELTGCVYDAKLVTVVRFDEQDNPKPYCKSLNFVWTEENKKRAIELRRWWNEELNHQQRETIVSDVLQIKEVKGYCRFDLYCIVMNKFVIDDDAFVLTVRDNTLSPIESVSFTIEDNSFSFKPREGKYEIDIFFTGQQGFYHSLSVNDNILLTRILCLNVDSDSNRVYKFVVTRDSNTSCTKIDSNHPLFINIRNEVEKTGSKKIVIDENESEFFSQKSAKSGHRLDQLNICSQKSYVESRSSVSTRLTERPIRQQNKEINESEELHSSTSTNKEDNDHFNSMDSIFKYFSKDSVESKKVIEISDIPLVAVKPFGRFVTSGIIKAIHPNNPMEMVITICVNCKDPKPIEGLDVDVLCRNCGRKRHVCFNFLIVIQNKYNYIDVFVTGYYAELFLGTNAEHFLVDRRVQGEIVHKLRHLVLNQFVELTIAYLNIEDDDIEYYSVERPHFLD